MSKEEFRELILEMCEFFQGNVVEKDGVYTCYFTCHDMINIFSTGIKTHAIRNKRISILIDVDMKNLKVTIDT